MLIVQVVTVGIVVPQILVPTFVGILDIAPNALIISIVKMVSRN